MCLYAGRRRTAAQVAWEQGQGGIAGGGSIGGSRDATREDFLTDKKIPFEMVAPSRNSTKLSAEVFKRLTGWQGRTSEHSRDAAMLVFGLNANIGRYINSYKDVHIKDYRRNTGE